MAVQPDRSQARCRVLSVFSVDRGCSERGAEAEAEFVTCRINRWNPRGQSLGLRKLLRIPLLQLQTSIITVLLNYYTVLYCTGTDNDDYDYDNF